MPECEFHTCKRHAQANGYCVNHRIYSNTPTTKEPKKQIAKVAEKRKVTNKEYKKIVIEMAAESNLCEVRSPVCTGKMQGLNHKEKRSPSNLLDRTKLERCCNMRNLFIEENIDWAQENGHLISKFLPIAIASHDQELNTTIIEPIK